jgi:hypothetical protein
VALIVKALSIISWNLVLARSFQYIAEDSTKNYRP